MPGGVKSLSDNQENNFLLTSWKQTNKTLLFLCRWTVEACSEMRERNLTQINPDQVRNGAREIKNKKVQQGEQKRAAKTGWSPSPRLRRVKAAVSSNTDVGPGGCVRVCVWACMLWQAAVLTGLGGFWWGDLISSGTQTVCRASMLQFAALDQHGSASQSEARDAGC